MFQLLKLSKEITSVSHTVAQVAWSFININKHPVVVVAASTPTVQILLPEILIPVSLDIFIKKNTVYSC